MVEYIKEKDSLNTGRKTINEELTRSNNNADKAKIDSAEALLKAIASMNLSESVRNELNQIVIEGDSSVEAAQARVDEKGQSHPTLKGRIDDGFKKTTSQLNEAAKQTDLENGLSAKRDKTTKITSEDLDTSTDAVKIKPINISDELMEMFSPGGTVNPIIPNGGVTREKYAEGSIVGSKLDEQYRYKRYLNNNEDLNQIIDDGVYFINQTVNKPEELTGLGTMEVTRAYIRWVIQKIYDFNSPDIYWTRKVDADTKSGTEWKRQKNLDDIVKTPYLGASDNLNNTLDNSQTLTINAINEPVYPGITSWVFDSKVYKAGTNNNKWVIHSAAPSNPGRPYVRAERIIQIPESGSPLIGKWHFINCEYPTLQHSIIVNFGDSIFGNTQDQTSISAHMSTLSNSTSHNVGFGGCRMANHHTDFWDAFSMYRLAYAVTTGDYSVQNQALIDGEGTLPAYFESHLNLLKSINFNNVDYITIGYGTNDYTGGILIDNNEEDASTYEGALRYSLRLLFEKFPHIKVLVLTPTYRFWMDGSGNFEEDSDTRTFYSNGQTLPDFVECVEKITKEFKTPHLDNYFNLGINKFNYKEYFPSNDGTHHNAEGRLKMARKILSGLETYF